MKIAVVSSAAPIKDQKIEKTIKELSKHLYGAGVELVTGGCSGIPELIINEFNRLGGTTTVFSPDKDSVSHSKRADNLPLGVATNYFYKEGFSQRSIDMLKYVDGVIVLNGRVGTLSEFTMAIEEGVPVLVIKETGGIADQLEYILKIAEKEFPNNFIMFTKEVGNGIQSLMKYINDTNPNVGVNR